ncbi:hypothetical protein NAEGRDRAFT_57561 [Naegleria gruberi]|uniref:RGS domain-containing protein n=1 Tax=Naegleria gruberi TaxID=5762 RepID=D2V994_NAEGR|nr:uncharacterized protein NAEGRDRAFT_57561 [Naegleria gruberi]EFC46549.1 hypothetical protein NAEGRDRAFT_57561 [Naegleria gruberi]|eukprot:XP_002679293.1 hypothetical protein NAEGRDRAFT_57561 [Naegleria gruberi strain NEG-M]
MIWNCRHGIGIPSTSQDQSFNRSHCHSSTFDIFQKMSQDHHHHASELQIIVSPETTTNTLTSDSHNPMITSHQTSNTESSTQPPLKKKTTFASRDEHIATTIAIQEDKTESTSIFSKTTSAQSLSSQTKLRIKTCCGIIKLNTMRLLSVVAMFVNSIAFIAIAAVVINSYTLQTSVDTDLLLNRGDLVSFTEKTECAVKLTAYENRTAYTESYYVNYQNVTNLLSTLKQVLPSKIYTLNGVDVPTKKMDDEILTLVGNGYGGQALNILKSSEYISQQVAYDTFLQSMLDYSNDMAESKNSYIFISSIVNLVLVVIALVVVVPTVFVVFAMAIKKEGNTSKKLKKATAFMLLDTMEDEVMKSKFKEFCKMEGHGIDLFHFIEKTVSYTHLCEKQNEMMDKLAKNKGDPKAVRDFEKEKYILAFEIFAEYLDEDIGEYPILVSGALHECLKNRIDDFSINEAETYLKENLFEDIQKEVAMTSLNDLHFKFKQFLMASKKLQVKTQQ